jgi:hypothetical protein
MSDLRVQFFCGMTFHQQMLPRVASEFGEAASAGISSHIQTVHYRI